MDIALVTGADAGPGLAIARRLIGLGCRVYALASQFARNPFPHDDFLPISCDLADPAALTKVAEDIVAREGHVSFVVHAARRAPVSLLDTPVSELAARVNTGLVAPLALARATLPWLRKEQGHFIVLCWNGDGPAPGGPVTAAIEGGLHHFAEALFDELRNDGVRATTVYARPNAETTPEAAMALDPQSAINPELVADAVENLLRLRPSNAISQIIIRPAATAETPRLLRSAELAGLASRDVQLPARQNFPQEPEPIPTPRAARPSDAPPPGMDDFEDEDEDEDFEMEPEAESAGSDRDGPSGPSRQGGQQSGPRHYDDQGQGGGRGGRGRRRRGRGGRGRGRGPFNDRPPQGGGSRGPAPAQGQPPPRDYPDAEAETEQRTFSRDDSFRTPHSDADEDNGGEPHDAERGDAPDARDDSPREDSHRGEPAPVHAETREEFSHGGGDDAPSRENREPRRQAEHHDRGDDQGRRGDDNRRGDHGQRPPQHSGNRPSGQQGGGPRRHRGYGRRPPPSAGPSRDRE
ncbi:MAG TPA: SDR family NAD(P)-dependent oxidoreductase [Opitutales bacterium]|nr:SDR family NAD(P)-dependent oxidoreductase [Opitutales bacterium]